MTTLRDGERTLPFEALKNLSSEENTDNIENDEKSSPSLLRISVACVTQMESKTCLLIVVVELYLRPTAGFILDALDELGLAPDDITDMFVVCTDHIGGCINEDGSTVLKMQALK